MLWRQAAQIVWVPTPSHRSEWLKENSSIEGLTVFVPVTIAAWGAIRWQKPACFIAGIRVLGRVRNSSSQTRAFSGTGKRIWKGWICPHKQAYVLALCDTNSELAHYHTVPSRYPFSFLNSCQIDSSKLQLGIFDVVLRDFENPCWRPSACIFDPFLCRVKPLLHVSHSNPLVSWEQTQANWPVVASIAQLPAWP